MNEDLYAMIWKRKSFHLFKDLGEERLTDAELKKIEEKYSSFKPLDPKIKTAIKIVKASEADCDRGEEYCVYFYSETKNDYLRNIGYLGEQLDLYLSSQDIASLWFGIGKEDNKYQDLDFVIMMAISKVSLPNKFRKDLKKAKRKELNEIWQGDNYPSIGEVARFAPSACNTQPWIVEADKHKLTVYRYQQPGKRGIMPADKVSYFNRIDTGIFLLILEVCLNQEKVNFERILYHDDGEGREKTKIAEYPLN